MSNQQVFNEHDDEFIDMPGFGLTAGDREAYFFPKKRDNQDNPCYALTQHIDKYKIKLSYFIGLDWVRTYTHSICVEPKQKGSASRTDYLTMLLTVLGDAQMQIAQEELFTIKFDEPFIDVRSDEDFLTPLLIIRFVTVVREIVRKGLKRSYYPVKENLFCRVRGKILVSDTIKRNVTRGRHLHTWCGFDVLDLNGPENRMLKKALEFSIRYVQLYQINGTISTFFYRMFNYILPAFSSVPSELVKTDINHHHKHFIYKDYQEGIQLAELILRRFGYQPSRVPASRQVATPPFWIDMSKLFELYVLTLLRERFPGQNHYGSTQVVYQYRANRNELDFLLDTEDLQGVGDAKYKYQGGKIDDVRQVSGYCRLTSVMTQLRLPYDTVINGIIFFFDPDHGVTSLNGIDLLASPIPGFLKLYKVGIKLPTIE